MAGWFETDDLPELTTDCGQQVDEGTNRILPGVIPAGGLPAVCGRSPRGKVTRLRRERAER